MALEAFKADAIDWRIENSAKNWATAYDFPAVADRLVLLEEFPIKNVGMMQAFAFNIRREKFHDPRVRLAFNFAFDFEEIESSRSSSASTNASPAISKARTSLGHGCRPAANSNSWRRYATRFRTEVFKKPYANPVAGNPAAVRANLRQAVRLSRKRATKCAICNWSIGETGEG